MDPEYFETSEVWQLVNTGFPQDRDHNRRVFLLAERDQGRITEQQYLMLRLKYG